MLLLVLSIMDTRWLVVLNIYITWYYVLNSIIKAEGKPTVDIFAFCFKDIKVNLYFMKHLILPGIGPHTKSYGLIKYHFNRFFHKNHKS